MSRHNSENDLEIRKHSLSIINNQKDLEWLAWNWRTWNNSNKFKSRRLMIFGHFNKSLGFLPTPEQILYGIVLAQIDQFANESLEDGKVLIGLQVSLWK